MTTSPLQRRAGPSPHHGEGWGERQSVPPLVHEVLRSPGQPLDPTTHAFMESRFGHDFSQVRVHTDERAARSAQAVRALAFTVGQDVVFDEGQYAPETAAGQRLLAHELTHTRQQGGSGPARDDEMQLSYRETAAESEADAVARAFMQGEPMPAPSRLPLQIARQQAPPAPAPPAGAAQPAPPACPVAPLMPITDADALAMEGGATVIWNHTSAGLQTAANQLITLVQAEPQGSSGGVQSAYRPQAYQDHLREVWDHARALQNNNSPACAAVRTAVNQEMAQHGLDVNRPVARVSNHTAGNAVDIDWHLPSAANEETRIDALAAQAGLRHALHAADRPHFEL